MPFKKLFVALLLFPFSSVFAMIHIVAAENFYGDIASTLGGDHVSVISVMKNPDQDPHLFTTSPSIAKAVATADIVIYNGAHYDDWMMKLLSVPSATSREVIVVAETAHLSDSKNPHIWYNPEVISSFAKALVADLQKLDPPSSQYYADRLQAFLQKQQQLQAYIQTLRGKFQGLPVTATEPVFDLMADALGLRMENVDFQWSVENEGSPSPREVQRMMEDLKTHQVRALLYNVQVTSPLVDQVKSVAQQNHIPVVGVSETQPPGMNYDQWMRSQLDALSLALSSQ